MKLEKKEEKSKSRIEDLNVEEDDLKNRHDLDRHRSKDQRTGGKGLEKDMRKRRSQKVNRRDSEVWDDEEREKHKEKYKKQRQVDHKERDGYKDRKREREREREERVREKGRRNQKLESSEEDGNKENDDDGDVKRDLKYRRKELEKSVGRCSRIEDDNGEKDGGMKQVEDEQKKVDDEEVEKRRRRRLQEWKELKRKNEEAETKGKGSKAWTLDGESDDEEVPHGGDRGEDEEVIDPLDAFMNTMVLPEVEKLSNNNVSFPLVDDDDLESGGKKVFKKALGRIIQGEDSDSDYSEPKNDEEDDKEFMKRIKKTKAEKLSLVDHSKIEYEPFRKNFYIEVKDISRMTQEEVNAYRKELEIKVHGKDVPKPIKSWHQTGLTSTILNIMKKLNYEKPMPIQGQALPIIMSGRDCIGVAKTGSGKTLGFVLPLLRHIKDQPLVEDGDGPIGLVMAPTRELVKQIHGDIKKFAKPLGIRCVPVYGGSGVAQQINALKRGTEIVVCTPGRMIDILGTSSGKITNLQRVTFLVMDEADRMFDMGFEPQIKHILQNIRPDRQTVLFSATFPRQIETLARKVLNKPVEIQVGGRSVVNKDITQLVEIRKESERFLRLVELLEEWYEKGKILIFVQSQKKCDALVNEIIDNCHYPCLSLHGGMDQISRETNIYKFKSSVCNLLIATSVAARGLDVKEIELVVNFDAPNHYEDYVHRVGRTGRAGRKGCAVTFISKEDDAKYAPDLVKALQLSEQPVPDELKAVADCFMEKVKQGIEQAHGTGYGGSGFKFDGEEEEVRKAAKKAQAKEYGFEVDESDSEDDENDVVRKVGGNQLLPNAAAAMVAVANAMPEHYEAEMEINDFPQNARGKMTHKGTLGPISECSGAAITTRGQFYAPGRVPGPGERKLYLFIEGPTEISVKTAKAELKRVLEDITKQTLSLPGRAQPGRYSVL